MATVRNLDPPLTAQAVSLLFFWCLCFPICNHGNNDSTTSLAELLKDVQVNVHRALSAQHAVSTTCTFVIVIKHAIKVASESW